MIFLACDALGITGSAVRGFRGPGRFDPGVGVETTGMGSAAGAGAELSPVVFPSPISVSERGVGVDSGNKRGHFFASSESSGTSTMSLEKRRFFCGWMQRRERGRT